MEFGWVALVIICVIVYAVVCWEIKKRNFHPEIFAFMGPCLMVRTSRTGIFDVLARFRRTFLVYGTLGVVVVAACSVLMTVMIIVTAYLTMLIQPDPSPIIQPQNLLLIPGVNDFVPSTFAVWFALVFAVVIHEFGHGLLSRVEKIRVKSESYDVRSLLLRVYRRTSAAAARIGRRSHPKKRRFFTCAFLSMSGKTPEMTDGRSCRPRAR